VLTQDTKHEMIAYVKGYILALEDMVKDLDHDKVPPLDYLRIIKGSLTQARETLEALNDPS
jgi:hypothetical protein